jgi:hypothetical protein
MDRYLELAKRVLASMKAVSVVESTSIQASPVATTEQGNAKRAGFVRAAASRDSYCVGEATLVAWEWVQMKEAQATTIAREEVAASRLSVSPKCGEDFQKWQQH